MSLTRVIFSAAPLYLLLACATRAPSEYELDRRAGLLPTVEVERLRREAEDLKLSPDEPKTAREPQRARPRLERLWVYDQELDGASWLQGTYVYIELEPSRWLDTPEARP